MRAENVEKVRKWWLANDARGLSAGEGAAACAADLACSVNSVRGWQRDAFSGTIAPWQEGYTRSTPAEKTCPKCKRTEGEVVFGVRKMWRGGELKLVRQSYCNKCR